MGKKEIPRITLAGFFALNLVAMPTSTAFAADKPAPAKPSVETKSSPVETPKPVVASTPLATQRSEVSTKIEPTSTPAARSESPKAVTPKPSTSEAPRVDSHPTPSTSSSVAPTSSSPSPKVSPVATVGTAQSGLQLALADAAAIRDQALAAAGNDAAARKAAQAQYAAQVKLIKKAIGTSKK